MDNITCKRGVWEEQRYSNIQLFGGRTDLNYTVEYDIFFKQTTDAIQICLLSWVRRFKPGPWTLLRACLLDTNASSLFYFFKIFFSFLTKSPHLH